MPISKLYQILQIDKGEHGYCNIPKLSNISLKHAAQTALTKEYNRTFIPTNMTNLHNNTLNTISCLCVRRNPVK